MTMDWPLVSIVILSFNRRDDLQETLEVCRSYTYPNLEMIVVDNGSTDGSAEDVAGLEDRFRTILLDHNTGSAGGHATGMRAATGELVITIDDDAFVENEAIYQAVKLFRTYPKLGGISFNQLNTLREYIPGVSKTTEREVTPEQVENGFDLITESAAAFRKSVLEEVDYHQNEFFYGGEDNELSFKMIAAGYRTLIVPHLVAYHKITATSRDNRRLTRNSVRNILWMLLQFAPLKELPGHLLNYHWYLANAMVQKRQSLYLSAWWEALMLLPRMLRRRRALSVETWNRVVFPYRMAFLW